MLTKLIAALVVAATSLPASAAALPLFGSPGGCALWSAGGADAVATGGGTLSPAPLVADDDPLIIIVNGEVRGHEWMCDLATNICEEAGETYWTEAFSLSGNFEALVLTDGDGRKYRLQPCGGADG